MEGEGYTARIGLGVCIAEDVGYADLVRMVLQFMIEAALAKASDEFTWEQEDLRRRGLEAIEFACGERALWSEREIFQAEEAEAERERVQSRFAAHNELDPNFFHRLDADLRLKLRIAGYQTDCLRRNMRELFLQIAAEAGERSAHARKELLGEIVGTDLPREAF